MEGGSYVGTNLLYVLSLKKGKTGFVEYTCPGHKILWSPLPPSGHLSLEFTGSFNFHLMFLSVYEELLILQNKTDLLWDADVDKTPHTHLHHSGCLTNAVLVIAENNTLRPCPVLSLSSHLANLIQPSKPSKLQSKERQVV